MLIVHTVEPESYLVGFPMEQLTTATRTVTQQATSLASHIKSLLSSSLKW